MLQYNLQLPVGLPCKMSKYSHISVAFKAFCTLQSAVSLPSLTKYKRSFVFLVHPYNSFERDSMAVNELVEELNTTSKSSLLTISKKG